MKLRAFVLFAAVLAAPALSMAASVSYNAPFSFPLSPGSQTVSLPQFDTAGGTKVLTSISIDLDALIQAAVTAENDSAIAGNMGVDLTGLVKATVPSTSLTAGILQSAGPVPVAATDGTPDSGPDYYNFGTVTGSDSSNTVLFGGFAPYVGTGTWNATINGNGGFSVNGVTSSTIKISNFGASGEVSVTYNYNLVPEPSTLGLLSLGVAGLAMACARRRK